MSPDVPVRAQRLGARGRPYQLPCAVRKDGSGVFGTAVKKVSGTVGGIPVVVHYAGAALGQVVGLMSVNMEIPNDVQRLQMGLPLTLGAESISGTVAGLLACTLDEVRVSNVARSHAWIATQFSNQWSPSRFYTIGASQVAAQ